MDRRTFLSLCSAVGGLHWAGAAESDGGPAPDHDADIFPQPPPIQSLLTVPLARDLPWSMNMLFTCLQGIVNRRSPRIYFVQDESDQDWLEYYTTRYGYPRCSVADPWKLLEMYREQVAGLVLYDQDLPESANVATTIAGLRNLLPVGVELAKTLERQGFAVVEDLRGRWKTAREACAASLEEHAPQCHPHLLGAICNHTPHWTATGVWLRDYLVAHRVFSCDLSASLREREERALLEKVFARGQMPGCAIGWRCFRCTEHEYVAVAARHGFSMLNGLIVRNLTIHTAIPRVEQPLRQQHRSAGQARPLEKKVYLALMNTDGDALPAMMRMEAGRIGTPGRGELPYNWGVLPAAVDLLPASIQRLYEQATPNDYFVAATSGALYTYPYLRPDEAAYLRYTREYLRRADIRVVDMPNWTDEYWWQEVDLPGYARKLRRHLPECLGFVRGMGESAFERDYLDGGAPYIFCGEGIHANSDVYNELRLFIEANAIRPLFIFCLSNHTVTIARIKEALDRFPARLIDVVHLDEFMLLLQQARREGLLPEDTLYPDKKGLRALLTQEARAAWPGVRDKVSQHAARAAGPENTFRERVNDPIQSLCLDTGTPVADMVAFDALWDAMALTKAALNLRGVYVNNKERGARDFAGEFGGVEDATVVRECWRAWERWERHPLSYEQGGAFAQRLGALASRLDSLLMTS